MDQLERVVDQNRGPGGDRVRAGVLGLAGPDIPQGSPRVLDLARHVKLATPSRSLQGQGPIIAQAGYNKVVTANLLPNNQFPQSGRSQGVEGGAVD